MDNVEFIRAAANEMRSIDHLYTKYDSLNEKYWKIYSKRYINSNLGIIGRWFANIFVAGFFVGIIDAIARVFWKFIYKVLSPIIALISVGIAIWLIVTLFVYKEYSPLSILFTLIYKKKLDKAGSEMNQVIRQLETSLNNTHYLVQVPPEFCFPQAVYRLEELLVHGRADSLK